MAKRRPNRAVQRRRAENIVSTDGDFEVLRSMPLRKSIWYAGEELTELHFRAPEAKLLDIVEAAEKTGGASLSMLAWFTGIGRLSLERMSWADTDEACAIVDELMTGGGEEDEDEDEEGDEEKSEAPTE